MLKQDYSEELYFGEGLQTVFARSSAIAKLVQFFNTYHWGPPEYEICGDANTPADQPVIRGRHFLVPECMEAASLGFRRISTTTNVVPLKDYIPK